MSNTVCNYTLNMFVYHVTTFYQNYSKKHKKRLNVHGILDLFSKIMLILLENRINHFLVEGLDLVRSTTDKGNRIHDGIKSVVNNSKVVILTNSLHMIQN